MIVAFNKDEVKIIRRLLKDELENNLCNGDYEDYNDFIGDGTKSEFEKRLKIVRNLLEGLKK